MQQEKILKIEKDYTHNYQNGDQNIYFEIYVDGLKVGQLIQKRNSYLEDCTRRTKTSSYFVAFYGKDGSSRNCQYISFEYTGPKTRSKAIGWILQKLN